MGMYDYFNCDTSCPVCGAPLEGFQTKDFSRIMRTYKPGDYVMNLSEVTVYTYCIHNASVKEIKDVPKCNNKMILEDNEATYIKFTIPVIDHRISRDQNLWKREIEDITFTSMSFTDKTEPEIHEIIKQFNNRKREEIRLMKEMDYDRRS